MRKNVYYYFAFSCIFCFCFLRILYHFCLYVFDGKLNFPKILYRYVPVYHEINSKQFNYIFAIWFNFEILSKHYLHVTDITSNIFKTLSARLVLNFLYSPPICNIFGSFYIYTLWKIWFFLGGYTSTTI